ncbi:MAG: hypothetical protein K8T26_07295 [Lentisphaerae bacterium]|nr:hypothetical protein [Lentisphaerota bacterium]
MSLSTARAKLMVATKALTLEWQLLESGWRDARHRDFQCIYMDRLTAAVDDALHAMTDLDERLAKIRHDCE